MKIAKGDFVELDFTGKLDDGRVFDTTETAVAKEQDIQQEVAPIITCVGERFVVEGLDNALEGKSIESFTVDIPPEQGFGKKDPKLLRLIPLKLFKKENIQPIPGLEVMIDNQRGIIRTVSGGRIIVDFNNPLSSETLHYTVTIKRKVEDKKEQAEAFLKMFHLPFESLNIKENSLEISSKAQLPPQLIQQFKTKLIQLVKLKDVVVNP